MKLWNSDWPSALAPMQDVTGLPFMRIISNYGAPDLFFTEFFRVHQHSRLDPEILSSITDNPSGKPILAQLIGESVPDLRRSVEELLDYPIAGVDLNMGCPAPRVYRKKVGGALLKAPAKIREILFALRSIIPTKLTVKMRIGFEDDRNFEEILQIINDAGVDLLSLHTRTVLGGYRSLPDHSYVTRAIELLKCPVLLNGNVTSAHAARDLMSSNQANGVMIGRAAIRNPWIFRQIRELQNGQTMFRPKMKHLHQYVVELLAALGKPGLSDPKLVSRSKKFLNFIGLSVCPKGEFLHCMRRTQNSSELLQICRRFMLDEEKEDSDFPLEPFENLVARPSQESAHCSAPFEILRS